MQHNNKKANVPNKAIRIPADTSTRSKHGHKFHIKPLTNDISTVCQNH